MTNRRASSRAFLACAVAMLCGAAFLRATIAREIESNRSRAREIGLAFGHRLEAEMGRLGAVSETLSLMGEEPECDSMRRLFDRLIQGQSSVQGAWQTRGPRTCALLDASRFPERDTGYWQSRISALDPGVETAVVGPFISARGGSVVLIVHRSAARRASPAVSTVLVADLVSLLSASGLEVLTSAGYRFAFRQSAAGTDAGPPFLGSPTLPRSALPFALTLPGAVWQLDLAGAGGWYASGWLAAGIALVLAISAALGLSTYGLLRQPELLRKEAELRKERLSKARERIHREAAGRVAVERRLEQESTRDPLTGLYNRRAFTEQLRRALEDSGSRSDSPPAVVTFDLDGFTRLNNTLGHEFGDRFIRHVAGRLRSTLREEHAAARIGPDEFAVLIPDCKSADIVARFATQLQSDLRAPFRDEGEETSLTASVGIAIGTGETDKAADLLRDAGIAMVQACAQGGGRHLVFERKMHSAALGEHRLEKELRSGIERGELRSFYQPILDLETHGIVGFEALIRWMHPQRGLVPPGEFLPMAERTGLILNIDRWCLKDALTWLHDMHGRHPAEVPLLMNANLSGKEFSQPDIVDFVDGVLRETRVPPASVSLEVTESVMMEAPERAIEILTGMKKLGVRLSLDDFGTGYSSLSYLHRFPLDSVKIDRSFVWNMSSSLKNVEIVRTVVRLAQTLNMRVVAEGIETEEQLQQLRKLSCRYGQGFLFSKPVSAQDAEALLSGGLRRETPARRSAAS